MVVYPDVGRHAVEPESAHQHRFVERYPVLRQDRLVPGYGVEVDVTVACPGGARAQIVKRGRLAFSVEAGPVGGLERESAF
ncbi:hypothetical protein Shyhy02_14270 [Streptomyces hygroscopicus subsp. hygroscopicus]|nr:hypothetical protein Shyhy02_14270 [Streptomyces hygroscopicus subsp. hygroscopicus]